MIVCDCGLSPPIFGTDLAAKTLSSPNPGLMFTYVPNSVFLFILASLQFFDFCDLTLFQPPSFAFSRSFYFSGDFLSQHPPDQCGLHPCRFSDENFT